MSEKSPASASLGGQPTSSREDEPSSSSQPDPDLVSLDSVREHPPKKRFFHELNQGRHKAPGVSAVMPHAFHRWTHRKAREHVVGDKVGSDDGQPREDGVDEEANAGRRPRVQNDDPDKPGFRMKNRYLPIISGLACPFSVLLDVSTHLLCR